MNKAVFTLFLALLSMTIHGQTYTALWKQAEEAEKKDLPRTQYDVLMKIVAKAQKENQYGQLMAAELAGSRVMATIAPDSLQPAVERMEERCRDANDKALATVYAVVLKKIYSDNSELEGQGAPAVTLDEETCRRLAAVKATDYEPLTIEGKDSRWFDGDLLSVVGYELEDFAPLNSYYMKAGNRVASLMTALELARRERPVGTAKMGQAPYIDRLDSLIALYGDLPECGEVALERYQYMSQHTDATPAQLWDYSEEALQRWGKYGRADQLRNAQKELTAPQFEAQMDQRLGRPSCGQTLKIRLRHVDELTLHIYKAKVNGNTRLYSENGKDYKQLKPLLTELTEHRQTRHYTGHQAYDLFEDSLLLPALPVGVYMIEIESKPATMVSRRLYFVSRLRVLTEALPNRQMRYVVVDAEEGQPVKGATIELTGYSGGRNDQRIATLATDAKGEATYQYQNNARPTGIYAYTTDDKASLPLNSYNNFNYNEGQQRIERTQLMTDRAIYRPGQTVRVAAVNYEMTDGYKQKALEGRQLTLTLRDANYKVVAEQTLTTDRYGTCATEFTLPANALTGRFTVQTQNGSRDFRVEDYKRPTFEVKFDEVNEDYKDGDTLTVSATARSYAGVPVQGARVKYTVERQRSLWWWSYSRYWNVGAIGEDTEDNLVAEGETMTDADGHFTVRMPMTLPKADYPMFYNFVCQADVTDLGGETHQGQLSLPLGNRKTALTVDLPDKIRADQMPKVALHRRNAAGNNIETTAKYRIDNGQWLSVKTNTECAIFTAPLNSGRHQYEAVCQGDTVRQQFTVFSLDDQRPAADCDDWFYQSESIFPSDGSPVTIQVGSSANDVHIVYSIISGNRVIESGAVDRSNQLINRKLTYKEEYGNGLLLTFAWVKQGEVFTHTATIMRPLPNKQLKVAWQTFRDRLTPGQQEEWTLTVKTPDGQPADAQVMATLYDHSLDQIVKHFWPSMHYQTIRLPNTSWQSGWWGGLFLNGFASQSLLKVPELVFTHFDASLFPQMWMGRHLMRLGAARPMRAMAKQVNAVMTVEESVAMDESKSTSDALQGRIAGLDVKGYAKELAEPEVAVGAQTAVTGEYKEVPLRTNLQETAFFYPQLATDSEGRVNMKFTLPESLTTWRFMGLAHTTDLSSGLIEGEVVAKKDLMVQPNMPRFIREGDKATITARIVNSSERDLSGTAWLTLVDPETEQTVLTQQTPFAVEKSKSTAATFHVQPSLFTAQCPLLIAKVSAVAGDVSDGEQHYLPVLPNRERVTVTVPFTQNGQGIKEIDLTQLFDTPSGAKLTIEYTNNPAWLMIQALPAIGHPHDDCAVCQAASLYANSIGKHIVGQMPQAKTVFEQWKREQGSETSLHSQLEKNQELKDLVLNETPWVADADRESEQRQRMADFFDENLMQQRLQSALDKLGKLQRPDGSWSWWPDMPGSTYMTVAVAEMLTRLHTMTGQQGETARMLTAAMKFLGREMVDLVKEMKKEEKRGHRQTFPSRTALEWLYICTLDGRPLPTDVQQANKYLVSLLKKDTKNQTIYEKAMSAIVLNSPTYIKSLKEYTVYKEETGRYYDTPRAGYSWRDYRIPTQVAAIEAIERLTPDDRQTLTDMRRWLLQQKRTQAWDTPLNAVDAVYAFLSGESSLHPSPFTLHQPATALKLDGQPIATPKSTAGLGYVKVVQPFTGQKTFTAEKLSEGTSWGAVYAQFLQPTSDVNDQASGISVKREIVGGHSTAVGHRVTVRITIQSERDLDFVQLQDKRAACMEPVSQLSGYNWQGGYYMTPRDNVTNYYFDRLSKGKHVIETEYYIDREGEYQTGTCTVQCAYAPEYRGTTHSAEIKVKR